MSLIISIVDQGEPYRLGTADSLACLNSSPVRSGFDLLVQIPERDDGRSFFLTHLICNTKHKLIKGAFT